MSESSPEALSESVAALMARIAAREGQGLPADRLRARLEDLQRTAVRLASVPAIRYPEDLPISRYLDVLRTAVRDSPVVVVAGETGSGKTTQLPKLCLELGRGVTGMIGHTQPRRLAARAVAARVAEELGVAPGGLVGHAVRFDDRTAPATLVKVMTDGILLNELARDRDLRAYDTLIVDEAHERSLNIDFLLGVLRQLLRRRQDMRLIVTSATIDVERFSAFFGGAPVVQIEGRGYPVEVRYLSPEAETDGTRPDLEAQVRGAWMDLIAREQARRERPIARDVLVFLPGEREISEVAHGLRRAALDGDPEVLPLYARLPASEQARVFAPGGRRRIVLSTNVAETSLTVPRIGYVIDSGLVRMSRYSLRSKIQQLPIEGVSQASAEQRKGRCGRVGPGVCYRLYDEADLTERPAFTDAEILRTNLAAVVLRMKHLGLGDLAAFPLMDPPAPRAIADAERLLLELQAINADGTLTAIGREMAALPVDPRLARMLVAARAHACLPAALVIVAALAASDPRERPTEQRAAADAAHALWRHERSDFLTFVNLWNWFEARRQELSRSQLRTLCRQHFLSFQRMWEWRDVHRQLRVALDQRGDVVVAAIDEGNVHRAVLTGLLSLIGQRGDRNEYRGARGLTFFLWPASVLFARRPPWVMAAEIVGLERVSARVVGGIEPAWLEAAAAHLIVRSHDGAHWQADRGRAAIFERGTLYGLPVYEQRRVALDRIDPEQARGLLLREGLVHAALARTPEFLRHNQALIRKVVEIEERTRRRDLLVSEDALLAFYDAHVPRDVVDVHSLERFVRKRPEAAAALTMTESDVRARALEEPVETQYPGELTIGTLSVRVVYRFAPGAPEDGVCLQVPVGALAALSEVALSWLVPGYLAARVEALVRALPRSLRKELTPMPEVLPRILEAIAADAEQRTRHLAVALSDACARVRSVQIPVAAWDDTLLPEHLRANLELVDARGGVIDRGRDLAALKRAHLLPTSATGGSWREEHEAASVTDFPLAGIAEQVALQVDGALRVGFPALTADAEGRVALRLLDDPLRARTAHAAGVVGLLFAHLPSAIRDVRKAVPGFERVALKYAPLGSRGVLVDQLRLAAAMASLPVPAATIRSAEAFRGALVALRDGIARALVALVADTEAVLDARAGLRAAMAARPSPAFVATYADVNALVDRLAPPDFVARHGAHRLADIGRYLRAAQVRVEGLQGRVLRDRERSAELAVLSARLQALIRQHADDDRVRGLEWVLEELRVAIFAPGLQARRPKAGAASPARVAEQILELERELGVRGAGKPRGR